MHHHKANRLVNITAGKNQQEGRFPDKAGQADAGEYHQIHEGDFQNGSEGRIARRAIGVVLNPVAHADDGSHAVNHQHPRADCQRFALQAHGRQNGLVGKDKGQTNDEDKSRAQIHQPFGPLVGRIQLARAHAFAHQHGGGIGEARKEADHQTLQRAEYGGGGNRLLRLPAQHHVHDHVADTDQDLIHQNGKALMEVFRHKGLGPDEVLGNAEQIGVLLDFAKQQNDQNVHGGGADLIFPHHENEIAQSECATGQPLANIWMHNGMLNVDGAKMSKSKGNFFMVRDLSKEYGYEPIRFMLLSVHYRSQLNYTLDVIESCKAALQRLYTCRDTLNRAIEAAPEGEASAQALADVKEAQEQFIRVMDDDFNTADGISTIFELVRKINTAVSAGNATKGTLKAYNDEFTALTNVLGLLYNNNDEEQIPAEITELIEKRKEARKAKDFALADSIRDQIKALGWVVEETRQGTIVKKA